MPITRDLTRDIETRRYRKQDVPEVDNVGNKTGVSTYLYTVSFQSEAEEVGSVSEGYLLMSMENERLAEESWPAISEIWPKWE